MAKKESVFTRISRGFKIMIDKLKGSTVVKNMIAEQNQPDSMSTDLSKINNTQTISKESNTPKKEESKPDPFATDFSKLGQIDI